LTMPIEHGAQVRSAGTFSDILYGLVRFITGVVLCLTPVTAIVVLGWLSRKTNRDVRRRLGETVSARGPNLVFGEPELSRSIMQRWTGALRSNMVAGAKAWLAVLMMTLPFVLVWFAAWVAGWENSFNKGYENAAVWPVTSLLAVVFSLPAMVALPMAMAHQARVGTVSAITDVARIMHLIRLAGWSYFALTLLIGLGCIGVFGARVLPTFAEHIDPRLASGSAEDFDRFKGQFVLLTTAALLAGLLVVRHVMARVYARAYRRLERGDRGSLTKTLLVCALTAAIWAGLIFLIHFAQFLNYNWWSWINQPVFMLPWLGIV